MSEGLKRRLGWVGLAAGAVIFSLGILAVHFTGLPLENAVGEEIYPSIPRGWQVELIAQAVALFGGQLMVAGVVVGWLWGREMTWARAAVGALVFTLEIVVVFGLIPNEWLSLTQGTLEFTAQRVALTIPPWLVLNNEVHISYAFIKDAVHAGWDTFWFVAMLVGMYQYQERKKRPAVKPQPVSRYGRPVVKGER